jgi:hypothetical protein
MCTDYNMPISCCTSRMSDSNMLRLQIVCRFVPAQLRQIHASACLPLLPPVPGEGSSHPRGPAKTADIREPQQL